ncbi:hypothetical protein AND_008130 [Anopheles darlingi]|uniref:CHK kinase-like domain-containing protein n=1 Tax=Anopheles darlingi TaxID=43151 RepID=W5JBU1_ANODA|nr:hypothetical protein AND_008130 [Anopheles darlingi]
MQLSNKDPTKWLTNQHFEKALIYQTKDRELKVTDVHLALHGDASQQYASTIYRACVSYQSRQKAETVNLVVKLVASKVNSITDESSFETELSVYRDVLSKMESILGDTKFGPELIFTANEPVPHMLLEDLTHRQFVFGKTLLNLDSSTVVVKKLAQFHAVSYSMTSASTNKLSDKLSNGLFKAKPSDGVKFMLENFGVFTEQLSAWEGYSNYAERFKQLQPTFLERGMKIYTAADGFSFQVLNHGDFHYNNMAFKQKAADQNGLADVLFFDYQLSCWTTPAVDLLYFFYLVCDRETREGHRQQLVQIYHQEFTETLSRTGFVGKTPSLLHLNCDLVRAGFLEVVIAVCFLPFLFADYDQAINVYGNESDAQAYRRKLYNREEYRTLLEPLLPRFLHQGFLG